MSIDLVFITHNRLDYTKLSLASILADPNEQFSLTIWDNASSDGTVEFLRTEAKDPRIREIVFAKKNVGQLPAVNTTWQRSKADLLGKLDNDCLMTPGWTRTLARAHEDIPELGVVACWHFMPEDFNYQRAKHKIREFGRHQILRHPWTCGTGLLFKRSTYERFGPMRGGGTTDYWWTMAKAGFVNGFYYPLIHQEHMDDPRSKYNRSRSASFEEAYKHTFGWQKGAFSDSARYERLHDKILENLLTGSYDPADYSQPFWRRALKGALSLTTGKRRVRLGPKDAGTPLAPKK